MDGFSIILLIIGLVITLSTQKKKKEAEARRKAAQRAQAVPAEHEERPEPYFDEIRAKLEEHAQRAQELAQRREEIMREKRQAAPDARWDHGDLTPFEKRRAEARKEKSITQRVEQTIKQSVEQSVGQRLEAERRHELEPSFLSGHAHVTNSLGSEKEEACPPAKKRVVTAPDAASSVFGIWSSDDLARGIIMSEILGKPKALRSNIR